MTQFQNDLVPPAPVGHNQPPETTSLQERYKELRATASAWIERKVLEDDETANLCDAFRKQVKLLSNEVEAERKRQKAPHLDAAAEVDRKFRPILDGLDRQHADMTAMVTAWLKRKDELLREAARAAAEEAERAKRIAEAAADEAMASGTANTYAVQDEIAAAAEAAEEAQAVADKLAGTKARVGEGVIAAGRKHATTLRSYRKVTGVSDRKKAFAFLVKIRSPALDFSKLDEALMQLTRQFLKFNADPPDEVPGIIITEETKAL